MCHHLTSVIVVSDLLGLLHRGGSELPTPTGFMEVLVLRLDPQLTGTINMLKLSASLKTLMGQGISVQRFVLLSL